MGVNNLSVVQSSFKRLALITASEMLAVILISALRRAAPGELTWLEPAYETVLGLSVLLTFFTGVIAWRNHRSQRLIWGPTLTALAVVAGLVVLTLTSTTAQGWSVVASLLLMAAHIGLLLFAAIAAGVPVSFLSQSGLSGSNQRSYFRFLLFTGAAILLLLVSGTVVSGTRAGLACPDWPLCEGEIFPTNLSLEIVINLTHRFSVLAVGVAVAAVVLQTRRRYPQHALLVKAATALGLLFLAQVALGGLNVVLKLPGLMSAAHLTLAMTIWGSLATLASTFYLTAKSTLPVEAEPEPTLNTPLVSRQKAAVYFKLTKPWILVLLLITTAGAMFIAAEGIPSISLILYTLLGGALAASGASVLNSYVDSDIDQLMSRTSRRPTVTGLVTPQETLFFGLALSTTSFLVFAIFVNPLSAALSTLGILYYVFFYTLYLKRATIHNIIIGGAAGAIPPLVGWTAVTNTLDLGALYLFAIIFFWTPPHTWALALLVKKDYANARVPMLPVVVGEKETTYQIFLYSILLVTLTILPFIAQVMGWLYLLAAVALGVPFLYLAWILWRDHHKSSSKKLYKYSQLYLALLFLMMALDRTLF